MKAVILAAGEGNRMRPLTGNRSKVMMPVANRPIAEHLVIELKRAGIDSIIFVTGYAGDNLKTYFAAGRKWGVNIEYVEQLQQLGTAHAIGLVRDRVGGPFIVVNGDIFLKSGDIRKFMASERPVIGLFEVENTEGLGIVEIKGDDVIDIHEKPANPPTRLANAALYFFTPGIFEIIDTVPKSPRGEYELPDCLRVLARRAPGLGYRILDYWMDVSYPWDLLGVNEALLAELEDGIEGEVEPGAVIKGRVAVGKGTLVRSGSYIQGPAVIGEGCDIGPNCFIRPSTAIGDGCHIGASVEIKNSIIMNGSKVPHLSYVGDSIIGERCNFGAGTKIANLRLDKHNITVGGRDTGRRKLGAVIGDDVQTGINVSINVGTVIGNGVFVPPGRAVSGIIADNTRVKSSYASPVPG